MNAIGLIAVVFFVIGWAAAIVASFYAAYHMFTGWSEFVGREDVPPHWRKALRGEAMFLGCALFTIFNGLIGAWFGGWSAAGR
jgi:hypothetical protein